MAEVSGWQQGAERGGMEPLFWLASELDASEEGRRRRQREKEQLLASAGILLPASEPGGDEVAMLLAGQGCPPKPYPRGSSPRGGMRIG
jgi:hypothetical protein